MSSRSAAWLAAMFLCAGATAAHAQAVITNGTIRMGIRQFGDLNTGNVPQISGTTTVGLRLITPAGDYEATADGCTCEGWGVGVRSGGTLTASGYANSATDGVVNLTPVSFTSTATSATSTVRLTTGAPITVVHEYRPSAVTPNLYEVNVTITNTGATSLPDIVYRRKMDWDISPTQFNEVVTLQGWPATNLIGSGNNGFGTAQPLGGACLTGSIAGALCNANFTTTAAGDQGAFFDFSFGALGAGESRTFQTFYGAASTQAELYTALGAVGAEIFTAAWCSPAGTGTSPTSCRGINGPAVFAFGFKGVGGAPPPVLPPPPPPGTTVPEPSTYALMLTGLVALGAVARRQRR